MSAFNKTLLRMLKAHLGRFIAILAIVALGIGLMGGLGAVEPKLKGSLDNYFDVSRVADIIIKSTSPYGFNLDEKEYFESLSEADALPFFVYDTQVADNQSRIYFLPLTDLSINKLTILEGNLPKNAQEIMVERPTDFLAKFSIGDKIDIGGNECTVCAIVQNPLLLAKGAETSTDNEKNLQAVFYFDSKAAAAPITTDIYLKLKSNEQFEYFEKDYQNLVDNLILKIKAELGDSENLVFLTLEQNYGAAFYGATAEKVKNISFIFSIFFIAVTALVVSTTMTRLVAEERPAVACYKTLGYANARIAAKYLLFAAASSLIGSLIGFFGLGNLVTNIIYGAFSYAFDMPQMTARIYFLYAAIASAAMFLTAMLATLSIITSLLKEKSAELLKPKAPKAGKKILLERIPLLWRNMSFKYKSTFRNLFRYLQHFFMTIISIAGSTAIVVAGFGLYDSSKAIGENSESMTLISIVLIICAALLSILVIYNLTNINISERKREIATLKVLGYLDGEVSGYIFREIFIMSLIGTLLGLPVGALFVNFVFGYVDFGSISNMNWYSWIFAAALSIIFTLAVDLLLYKKIARTDMNDSLKTVE